MATYRVVGKLKSNNDIRFRCVITKDAPDWNELAESLKAMLIIPGQYSIKVYRMSRCRGELMFVDIFNRFSPPAESSPSSTS